MKTDLFEVIAEIEGISNTINALAHITGEGATHGFDMTDKCLASQLWSIASHIDRVTEDLKIIEAKQLIDADEIRRRYYNNSELI